MKKKLLTACLAVVLAMSTVASTMAMDICTWKQSPSIVEAREWGLEEMDDSRVYWIFYAK